MNLTTLKHLIGAILLFAAAPVLAEAEKLGFKGVELGSNLAQIASNPKFDCRVVSTPIADKVCSLRLHEKETIAGAPIDSLFYFYDQTGLTGIVVNLDEKHFQPVVAALTEKFGSPSLKTETVKSLKGAAFENRTYRWSKPEGSLQAAALRRPARQIRDPLHRRQRRPAHPATPRTAGERPAQGFVARCAREKSALPCANAASYFECKLPQPINKCGEFSLTCDLLPGICIGSVTSRSLISVCQRFE